MVLPYPDPVAMWSLLSAIRPVSVPVLQFTIAIGIAIAIAIERTV